MSLSPLEYLALRQDVLEILEQEGTTGRPT